MMRTKKIVKIMAGTIGTITLSCTLFLLSGCSDMFGKKELKLGDGKGKITLKENVTSIQGDGLRNHDRTVEIIEGGKYEVSGTLENGQIYVEAPSDEIVELTLKGVTMENESEAAIYVKNAGLTKIIVDKDSTNSITCGKEIAKDKLEATLNSSEDASGAAIYAKDDLTMLGTGSLVVNGYINNGIFTKNDLVIEDGNYEVTALNNGIKGEDTVTINNGTMNISVGKDGIKAEKEIVIKNGQIRIPYCNEGIEANQITIEDGKIDIVSSDDGINANGGTSNFGKKDNGNTVKGNASEKNSDTDADVKTKEKQAELSENGEMSQPPQMPENGKKPQMPDGEKPQMPDGEKPQLSQDGEMTEDAKNQKSENETITETSNLTIRGGDVTISSGGDGLDSNGNILIEGGSIVIEGAVNDGNSAVDYGAEAGRTCVINGGMILALGQSGMAEEFDDTSKQCSFMHNYEKNVEAGTKIKICDENGNTLYNYTWKKGGNSVLFSSKELKKGSRYTLFAGEEEQEILLEQTATQSGEQRNGFGRRDMKEFPINKDMEKRNRKSEDAS